MVVIVRSLVLGALLAGSVSLDARAQPADDTAASKVQLARRLYDEGLDAVNKSRWSVAYDKFKASYELAPRVLTLFNLAAAQAQTGRVVDATESYRRFLRETADGRYPDLRTDATAQIEALEARTSQLTLDVKQLAASDTILLDQVVFPHAGLREPLPMNPGAHAVTVARDGLTVAQRDFELAPGAAETITLTLPAKVDLQLSPGSPTATPTMPRDTGAPPPPRDDEGGMLSSPWFWTAVVVIAGGAATGGYFLLRDDSDAITIE